MTIMSDDWEKEVMLGGMLSGGEREQNWLKTATEMRNNTRLERCTPRSKKLQGQKRQNALRTNMTKEDE